MDTNPSGKSHQTNPKTERAVEMTCPNCQQPIDETESVMEDRWGTKFCSVWCCDFYHESVHAEGWED